MPHCLLPDRAVVAVAGEDAESLLNRLVTKSVLGMHGNDARYAALLSPQGKLLFDFLVYRRRTASGSMSPPARRWSSPAS